MFDLTLTNEELARQLLVESPEGDETYDKGGLRALLYDPGIADRARYAAIFKLAAGLTDSKERQASFILEVVNGLRRQPGLWDITHVMRLHSEVRDLILTELRESERKSRLIELWHYHAGLIYREAGEYKKALEAQIQAAFSAPNPAMATISRFCAAVEACHHWLVIGPDAEDDTDMMSALSHLVKLGKELDKFRDDSDISVQQWVLANGPIHRLYAHYLAGVEYDGEEDDLEQINNLPEPHATTYASWRQVILALADLTSADSWSDINASQALDNATFLVVPTLLALLVLARVSAKTNSNELGIAEGLYKTIIAMPTHGGHFVRAIARREMAALGIG